MISALLQLARLLHAAHDGLVAFAIAWDDTGGCGHDGDPDGPDELTYHLGGKALHSLLEDAGIEAHNGSSPSEAADKVLFDVEMRYIEAGVDDQ